MRIIGAFDIALHRLTAFDERLGFGSQLWLDPVIKRCRTLWVKIAEEGAGPGLGRQVGEIDGCCRLPDTTLRMIERQGWHRSILSYGLGDVVAGCTWMGKMYWYAKRREIYSARGFSSA